MFGRQHNLADSCDVRVTHGTGLHRPTPNDLLLTPPSVIVHVGGRATFRPNGRSSHVSDALASVGVGNHKLQAFSNESCYTE